MRGKGRTVEERIAQKASSQHGVVTRTQLLAARITGKEIDRRLRNGSLISVHRGVFRVGHAAFSLEATYLAAVLACGDGALLSGRAAGHLWGILKGRTPIPEVTASTERRIAGVKTHRSRHIHPSDRALARGIPVTSVPATVVQLAA